MSVSDRMRRTSNCVGVCVDEKKTGFKGRIYHCFSKEPECFTDINEMFYIIDAVMDALSFPALKTKNRTFKRTDIDFQVPQVNVENKVLDTEDLIPSGEKMGYIIMVTSRDNATWQGLLYDQQKDVEVSFNSEVELVRLLK